MNKSILYIIFIFSLLFAGNLNAQVEAPDFLCVKSDTLFWDLPTNICGPFNAYNVYASDSFAGPFFLLASITDPNQTSYWHDNIGNNVWYYYLESDFNCPGEPVLQSVILDNKAPAASPILVANVINGKVQIEWQPSPSPQVIGYVIFKVTDIGTIPIDTIFNGTTYTDLNSIPNTQAENYYVIALDPCGNTSLLESPHRTVFLESTVSSCEQTTRLVWNNYEGWTSGIDRQELWLQQDGGSPELVETFSPTDTAFLFENLDDEVEYCFYIRSYENGSTLFSVSNLACFTSDIVQPMRDLILKNVTINADNEVELHWQWDINAEISSVSILTSNQNNTYNSIDAYPPVFPLGFENNYFDLTTQTQNGSVYYQVQTTDECDSLVRSNYVATVHLSGEAEVDFINQLSWTSFESPIGEVLSYELYRVGLNGTSSIANLSSDEFNHGDKTDPYLQRDANVCYYIIAEVRVTLADESSAIVYSRSNTVCIEQLSSIRTPNAFAPEGKNKEFKPLLVYGDQTAYTMSIWDRWGQRIFETTDINKGWTGRKGFFIYPAGAYTYMIKIVQPGGRVVEDSGVVILVR